MVRRSVGNLAVANPLAVDARDREIKKRLESVSELGAVLRVKTERGQNRLDELATCGSDPERL
jgi:hypothetical protein